MGSSASRYSQWLASARFRRPIQRPFFFDVSVVTQKKRRNNKKKKREKDEKRVTSVVGGSERNRRQEEETSGSLTHRVHGASLQKCNSPADDALNCNEMIVMQEETRERERERERTEAKKKTETREKEINSGQRRSG